VYTRKILISCSKSANKPSTSCVRTACPKLSASLKQLVNSCNKLVDFIRLVARLFQQVRCSHDITVLLPCVVNLVTFLLYLHVSGFGVLHLRSVACNKSVELNNLVASCQQAGNKQCEHILLTSCWNSIATRLLQVC
jgi:hypothetical protein